MVIWWKIMGFNELKKLVRVRLKFDQAWRSGISIYRILTKSDGNLVKIDGIDDFVRFPMDMIQIWSSLSKLEQNLMMVGEIWCQWSEETEFDGSVKLARVSYSLPIYRVWRSWGWTRPSLTEYAVTSDDADEVWWHEEIYQFWWKFDQLWVLKFILKSVVLHDIAFCSVDNWKPALLTRDDMFFEKFCSPCLYGTDSTHAPPPRIIFRPQSSRSYLHLLVFSRWTEIWIFPSKKI